jgi:hypothetical protein
MPIPDCLPNGLPVTATSPLVERPTLVIHLTGRNFIVYWGALKVEVQHFFKENVAWKNTSN